MFNYVFNELDRIEKRLQELGLRDKWNEEDRKFWRENWRGMLKRGVGMIVFLVLVVLLPCLLLK